MRRGGIIPGAERAKGAREEGLPAFAVLRTRAPCPRFIPRKKTSSNSAIAIAKGPRGHGATAPLPPPSVACEFDRSNFALVSLAVADHLQTVVVQPPAAETHLTASRWKRPAADRTTLNLGAVAARFGAGVSTRTLRKRAELRHRGLGDESGEQQQRHTEVSHMTRQRRFGVAASVFGASGTIEGAEISRSR